MGRTGNKPKRVSYDLFMLGLCLYVLAALAIETFVALDEGTASILRYADFAICLIFMVDFFASLIRAPKKLEYLRWGWIDFVSSIPMIDALRWGRAARAIRILRLLRGLRATKGISAFILQRRAESAFSASILMSILVTIAGSITILHFESGPNSNIQSSIDAIWWSIVTLTTVGYGDFFPVTLGGRATAICMMFAGMGLFGTFTGFIASWFLAPHEKDEADDLDDIREELGRIQSTLERIAPPDRD